MTPAPGPKAKCLVVDDIADNLLTMAALLGSDDVEVLTARSGTEALELLLQHDVALALLDVHMPGMDGFELAELMRSSERTRHVPLIFVTAGGRDLQRLFKGYDAGAVDFLFKPVEPWILESKARVFFDMWRLRQQLAQQLAERTETLRLHELFAGVLAHDLRDPLNAMLAAAGVIEAGGGEPAPWAARIRRSGQAMARMVADVLDLTRARLGGGIPLQPAAADLAPVFARVLDDQRATHPERRIVARLPATLHGTWDAARLGQVLANLVGNALQHGAPDSDIEIDAELDAALHLRVANAGEIDAPLLPQVFDPFRRQGRAGTARQGLGLGLYIVDQIVRAHGGSVHAECRAGRTTFHVSVPRDPGR